MDAVFTKTNHKQSQSNVSRRTVKCDSSKSRFSLKATKKQIGFTFVEVMVATAVLALAAGAMINALVIAQYSTQAARNRIIAFNLITARTEEIATWSETTMRSLVNGAGGTTNLVESTVPSVVTDPLFASRFQNRTSTITTNQNFYTVTVQIKWNEKALGLDRAMTESATTYILPTQ